LLLLSPFVVIAAIASTVAADVTVASGLLKDILTAFLGETLPDALISSGKNGFMYVS
jgi:hypothetical protein